MDKIKDFFAKKKRDAKFKKLGSGHALSQEAYPSVSVGGGQQDAVFKPGPSRDLHDKSFTDSSRENARPADRYAAEQAAQAAMRRMQVSQQPKPTRSSMAVKAEAQRRIEEERLAAQFQNQDEDKERRMEVLAPSVLPGIYFTCDVLGDDVVLNKVEMQREVEQFLRKNLETEDALIAASIMIYSLNGYDAEKRQNGVDVLGKYLQNIIQNPDDEKYRRIKKSNRVFTDKVAKLKGGIEFLKAVGFEECQEEDETYLVLRLKDSEREDAKELVDRLTVAYECLVGGSPVVLKLHRNPKVLPPAQNKTVDGQSLTDDFFELSKEEIRHEQMEKTRDVENSLVLRTREMRERDLQRQLTKYTYCLMRVRFPDNFALQGTFKSAEPLKAVFDFLRKFILLDWAPFRLLDVGGQILSEADDVVQKTLAELNLSPTALLRFELEPTFVQEYLSGGQSLPTRYLRE